MVQIMPIKDLRNTNEISERCHRTGDPIFITKNGYGDLVVMSIERYESMSDPRAVDDAIAASEAEAAVGNMGRDAKEVFAELRSKHFG